MANYKGMADATTAVLCIHLIKFASFRPKRSKPSDFRHKLKRREPWGCHFGQIRTALGCFVQIWTALGMLRVYLGQAKK
ncbi:hypothetical protein AMTR_s00122p00120460 [Amborella trichopoda]|uniref:Uncharacterized protein n=1 Tax=Amborella trichopoda TaxID=13333 RepID=W1NN87_AMBTC|nr:hypothetical protein AMTR_s00122p00120460 [Amborella trichopoda]